MRVPSAIKPVLVVYLLAASLCAQDVTIAHKFQLWGTLETQLEKDIFVNGWTNGFFHGPRSPSFLSFAKCIETKISQDQMIAMIDKFYKEHPERWNVPVSNAIVLALTVKDGPCAGEDPWRRS